MIDTIARDVFQHEINGGAEEMSRTLCRSAFSSIIWDMIDYACGILDPAGNTIAQAPTIPAQLGIMPTAFRSMVNEIPLAEWHQGDVIVCNDPYFGCTHTPDITLFSPVFADGRLVAVTSTVAHHIDVGGAVPGSEVPDAREIFEEGFRFPPVKLYERGRANDALVKVFARNVRDPKATIGDLNAQIAACRIGERRVVELCGKYGTEGFGRLANACLDYSEAYVRNRLAAFEPGENTAEVLIEDDTATAEPIRIRARVRVCRDRIVVDFSGSSEQRMNGLNCPYASALGMTHYAVKALLSPELPQTDGCNRPIDIIIPAGSVLNPREPAAVSARHLTQQAVADCVLKALLPFAPQTAAAGCQISFPTMTLGGFDRRRSDTEPAYFVVADILGGGMGASASAPGLSGIDNHGSNCALLSAEVMETVSPVRVVETALVAGSGGHGRQRGGDGMRRSYEILCDGATLTGYIQQTRPETAPWGVDGGGKGGLAVAEVSRADGTPVPLRSKFTGLRVDRGDVIKLTGAGGGGWGAAMPD